MILFHFSILEPKVETCCSICSPYNGLTILHHIEHRYESTNYPTRLKHLTSRAGLTTNLITLLLCLAISTSEAEFNTVPAQLWLCAPLLILCLVQVWKKLKSTSTSSSSAWSRSCFWKYQCQYLNQHQYLHALPGPGDLEPALHGGDGLVRARRLLRLLPLGEEDSQPRTGCHTYGVTLNGKDFYQIWQTVMFLTVLRN